MRNYNIMQFNKLFIFGVFFTLAWVMPSSSTNVKKYVLSSQSHYNKDEVEPSYDAHAISPDIDVGYLLTKLSDQEILQLLRDEPVNPDNIGKLVGSSETKTFMPRQHFKSNVNKPSAQSAFFRLEDKEVDPFAVKNLHAGKYGDIESHLKNILYSNPINDFYKGNLKSDDEEEHLKVKMFDNLVMQLKALCCNSKKEIENEHSVALDNKTIKQDEKNEHMFLIFNDELNHKGNDELITVDPDSLSDNSTVLLLGPIGKSMPDHQLLRVMDRIGNELSKTQYSAFLESIAEGHEIDGNDMIKKKIISGSTRRYIKPHRCNHQSKLAQVYGGAKWLVCTGYININTPSLYD